MIHYHVDVMLAVNQRGVSWATSGELGGPLIRMADIEYTFDEYMRPRLATLVAYSDRLNAGELIEREDIRVVGQACSEVEVLIDSVKGDDQADAARVRQMLRDLVASTREHLYNDVPDEDVRAPDDLRDL